jgi:hypothetical protein
MIWTRSYIISAAHDLPDLNDVTNRLLRNPKDFAKVLQKYYGTVKANRFDELLTEHLTLAAQLVNEAKAGDTAAANDTRRKWYQNADQIAEFLASINPYWSRSMWQSMLYHHLELVEREATERLNGQYAADIDTFDEIVDQGNEMADVMTGGIIKQFFV